MKWVAIVLALTFAQAEAQLDWFADEVITLQGDLADEGLFGIDVGFELDPTVDPEKLSEEEKELLLDDEEIREVVEASAFHVESTLEQKMFVPHELVLVHGAAFLDAERLQKLEQAKVATIQAMLGHWKKDAAEKVMMMPQSQREIMLKHGRSIGFSSDDPAYSTKEHPVWLKALNEI